MKRTLITSFITSMAWLTLAGSFAAAEDRGYLGVTIAAVENLDVGRGDNGIIITSVAVGSAASTAGIQANDRIVGIDDAKIEDMVDLEIALGVSRPGDRIAIRVLRGLGEHTFDVELGAAPTLARRMVALQKQRTAESYDNLKWVIELAGLPANIGLEMETLGHQLAEFFDVEAGVLVSSVRASSAAHEAGLLAGDILLEVDGTSVESANEVRRILHGHEAEDVVEIQVQREGRIEFFSVVLDPGLTVKTPVSILDPVVESLKIVRRIKVGTMGSTDDDSSPEAFSVRLSAIDTDEEALFDRIHALEAELEKLHLLRQNRGQD